MELFQLKVKGENTEPLSMTQAVPEHFLGTLVTVRQFENHMNRYSQSSFEKKT